LRYRSRCGSIVPDPFDARLYDAASVEVDDRDALAAEL